MEVAYVALGLSLVCNGALAWLVRKALPVAIVRDHRIIRTEIERVHDSVEGLQTRWSAKTIELTSLADECAAYMERAKRSAGKPPRSRSERSPKRTAPISPRRRDSGPRRATAVSPSADRPEPSARYRRSAADVSRSGGARAGAWPIRPSDPAP